MSRPLETDNGNQRFTIIDTPSKEDLVQIQNAVENHKFTQTGGEYGQPGIDINLALKDSHGNVQGGVIASTVFKVMHLEVLWVSEKYRRNGYGGQLVIAAEQIGFAKGCNTSQTWTFSFQGPQFYPTIGYQQIGIYDGYPNGITEYVFMKRLSPSPQYQDLLKIGHSVPDSLGLYFTTDLSEADQKILHQGLHSHVIAHIGDRYKGISIKLAIKSNDNQLIGGYYAWSTLQNLIFEYIWIEEGYRGKGLGRTLMMEGERIAKQNGCIASQAYSFSFQAPGFFEKMGYRILGVSDGYPALVKEYYLIKKFN